MNRLFAFFLICCLYAAVSPCKAQVIGLHTISMHTPDRGQVNSNWGVYMRTGATELGVLKNSYNRPGAYLSQQFDLAQGQYGAFRLQIGGAYGYKRVCTETVTTTPAEVKVKNHGDGNTSKSTTPARTTRTEECTGFSRGALTPLAGLSYTAPFAVLGLTPRVQFVPAFKDHASVFHLTIEKSL